MKINFLLLMLFGWGAISALAQDLNTVSFDSDKEWHSSRWYLIGRWVSNQEIRWLDGKTTEIAWDQSSCRRTPFIPRFDSRSNTKDGLELLRSGAWFAIEINPILTAEHFDLAVRKARTVEYCDSSLDLKISLAGKGGGIRPFLILQPSGTRYYGKQIDISIINVTERSNLQLDVQMAYWMVHLPSAEATVASSNLHLVPVALAHVEWLLSDSARWGTQATLEQSISAWGIKRNQNLIISNWGAGFFYQHFLRVLEGLQLRYFLEYSQFRADDGRVVKSVSDRNLEAHYVNYGLMSQLYFGDRWSTGIEAKYGWPNSMAARGGKQANYQASLKLNYRASKSITVLSTLGTRAYWIEDSAPERIHAFALGFRLDL